MQIYFLRHSAVCAVMKKSLLVFDYFMHEPGRGLRDGYISEENIKKACRVYAFASHAHQDHFNPCIFEWTAWNKNVTYILDETISKPEGGPNAVMLSRGKVYDDGYVRVQEFGSTDIGGSFYVECEGTSFFHAGDLNNWHWKDDGNLRHSQIMAAYFERELRFLKSRVKRIDYAFFPVDSRMGRDYGEGANLFIKTIQPRVFIPIHFVHFDDTAAFSKKHAAGKTVVMPVREYGQIMVHS